MPNQTTNWTKVDVIRYIASRKKFRRYFEITSRTTGQRFHEANAIGFDVCTRLVYNFEGNHPDDLAVEFSSKSEDISYVQQYIVSKYKNFDIILVDGYHTYDCASRDLQFAKSILKPGGVIVVHDCLPTSITEASPEFSEGSWCGVTYKAFLDFCFRHRTSSYLTVDTDYGCGVVFSPENIFVGYLNYLTSFGKFTYQMKWKRLKDDYESLFCLLRHNNGRILNLMSVEQLQQINFDS